MAFDLDSIGHSRKVRPKRVVVLGNAKAGKSTFAGSCPNPVFIPIDGEEGIDDLDVESFPPVKTFIELMDALSSLADVKRHGFGTVVIDSTSALEPVIWREVCERNNVKSIEKVGGGYGKGYLEALEVWGEVTQALDYLRKEAGMMSVLIGHVKVKLFTDPVNESYDRYQWDINDRAASQLTRWADGVLFIGRKVAVRKEEAGMNKERGRAVDTAGGAPMIFTQERAAHPGGGRGRWSMLPYEMKFGPDDGWSRVSAVLDGREGDE